MSLKTELQAALSYVNVKLTEKGAGTSSTVYSIGDIVDTMLKPKTDTWVQTPAAVKNYLDNVTYDPSDYSTSQIANGASSSSLPAISDWSTVKYLRFSLALNNAASAISAISDVTSSNLAIYAE